MKRIIFAASIFLSVACQSPESRTETTSDRMKSTGNENAVLNSPPGGSTDTSGAINGDTSHPDSLRMKMNPESIKH